MWVSLVHVGRRIDPRVFFFSRFSTYFAFPKKKNQNPKRSLGYVYRYLRSFNFITVATKSKRDQSLVYAKSHSTIKHHVSFNKLAVTIHKKVTLRTKSQKFKFNKMQKKKKSFFTLCRDHPDGENFTNSRGGSRIFFRRGCTTKEWRNWLVTRRRITVVLENRRSSQGRGGAHSLHPPPRSAPE